VLAWYQRILFALFRPRPPRPEGGESSLDEVASVMVQFIRAADRANGLMGKDHLLSFVRNLDLGTVGASTNHLGRLSFYFEPKAEPLAPDFRFDFSEDHEGTIIFTAQGHYRYDGFFLSGALTKPGVRNAREDWPTPKLSVSAEPGPTSPVTRHAKRLRDFFMSKYGAKDYEAMFKSFR
jgi:hypothetical protein